MLEKEILKPMKRIEIVIDENSLDDLLKLLRDANVRGAFAVEPLRAHELRGRRVVLVDDVMTTGASLHAAAQALRQAGVAHVTALVFARTPSD